MAFVNDAEFQDDFRMVAKDATADFEPTAVPGFQAGQASSENLGVAGKADDLDEDDDLEDDDDSEDEDDDLEDDDLEDDEEEEDDDDDIEDEDEEDDLDDEDEEDDDEELEDDDDTVKARNTDAAVEARRQ